MRTSIDFPLPAQRMPHSGLDESQPLHTLEQHVSLYEFNQLTKPDESDRSLTTMDRRNDARPWTQTIDLTGPERDGRQR